eukprot:m.114942 g.114942  ORF g.114942 m.114942 type:complete len:326 (+) comp14184_c1_seq3:135-1112(+)
MEDLQIGTEVGLLIAFSVAMFLGSFGAGYSALCLSVNPTRVRYVSLLGAGILIGTALIIIIPEGIHLWIDFASKHAEEEHEEHEGHAHDSHTSGDHDHGHEHGSNWQIGASLALGFAFMLLVEKLSAGYGHGHGSHAHGDSVSHAEKGLSTDSGHCTHDNTEKPSQEVTKSKSTTAMLGLIVHAAIDGVALGGSVYGGPRSSSSIVFLAIMLHKAPAAFGLTTYLTSAGINKRIVTRQLLIFSIAAPAGAFGTFYGMYIGVVGYRLGMLALIMLFSGGTFLFVATVHILPEVMHANGGNLAWSEVWLIVLGIIFPMFLNVGDHGH